MMKFHNSQLIAVALLGLAWTGSAAAAEDPVFASAAELKASVAKLKDGLALSTIPAGHGDVTLMVRRDRDGQVETHANRNDELIVSSGHASIMVGGKVEGDHPTTPGEMRGTSLSGGHVYKLAPGDALWIPAGVPHQVKVPKGTMFTYLTAKFPAGAH